MDELNAIQKLADLAQGETAPDANVSFAVMGKIRNARPGKAPGLSAFATVAALAAMLVLAVGIYCMLTAGSLDPNQAPSMQEILPDSPQLGAIW